MSDPERLLAGGAGPLAADLLAAGAAESPAPEVAQRALHAALAAASVATLASSATGAALPAEAAAAAASKLGVASGASGATALAKSTLLTSALAKWTAVGMVGASAVAGAPHVWQWAARTGAAAPGVVESSRRLPAAQGTLPTAPQAASAAAPQPHATPQPHAASAEPSRPAAAAPPFTPSPSRAKKYSTVAAPTLGAELARVDRARALLQEGDPLGSLRELASYESEFPQRQLALEVSMLRMEALLRSGQAEPAAELAEQILARGASPAHTARARAVLEAARR